MRKGHINILFLFILFATFLSCQGNTKEDPPVIRVTDTIINGREYLLLKPVKGRFSFSTQRPSGENDSVFLSVPAAYTSLKTMGVDGIYMISGQVFQDEEINRSLGGVAVLSDSKVQLFESGNGAAFTASFLDTLKNSGASFFQQTICVVGGQPEKFRDKKYFQRRGLMVLSDGSALIIESADPIQLETFSDDAASIGASEMVNLDMGAWDEGWYRDPVTGEIKVLGKDHSQTGRQTNWLIISK